MPAVVVVNSALLDFPNPEIFPWCLSIKITYSDLAKNEMPTAKEQELLNKVSDKIEISTLESKSILGSDNALFVARSTWAGVRELVFQVHDPKSAHHTLQKLVEREEWPLDWAYEIQRDPEWSEARVFMQLFTSANGAES